jgi:hypothetical protein
MRTRFESRRYTLKCVRPRSGRRSHLDAWQSSHRDTRPFFEVIQLSFGRVLKHADGGPGGLGAIPTPDAGDRMLSPGEPMTVTFVIRYQPSPLWIHVNLHGEPLP